MPLKQNSDLRLKSTLHPLVYEVNIRVFLNELSSTLGKKITLDRIPDSVIDEWSASGFDVVWLMGVWTTGEIGLQEARNHAGLQDGFGKALPDYTQEDIISSPYAVKAYTVGRALGGVKGLESFRKKLAERGIGLMLDFVPNHTARDHEWVSSNPEYYVNGETGDEGEDYFRVETKKGDRVLAHGKDPFFPGWTDTAQLNLRHRGTRAALTDTLLSIASQCDGVRCDMAMLVIQQVFADTWGERSRPADVEPASTEFWSEAMKAVRAVHPNFLFVAESYWDLEWSLQKLGFDYTYDKTLYDRLLREGASAVGSHLRAEMDYQLHSVRFVENHDEPRVASALPSELWQYAAATIAATVPGMFLLHEGQLDGRKVKLPVQLGRRPAEECSTQTRAFYAKLLSCLQHDVFRKGEWTLLTVRSAWYDNHTYQNILAYSWRYGNDCRLVVVNYAPLNSQGYVELRLSGVEGSSFEFRDLIGSAVYTRDRSGLETKGMYFDSPGYGIHIFQVKKTNHR